MYVSGLIHTGDLRASFIFWYEDIHCTLISSIYQLYMKHYTT